MALVKFNKGWTDTEIENVIAQKASTNTNTNHRAFVEGTIYFSSNANIYFADSNVHAIKMSVGSTLTVDEIVQVLETISSTLNSNYVSLRTKITTLQTAINSLTTNVGNQATAIANVTKDSDDQKAGITTRWNAQQKNVTGIYNVTAGITDLENGIKAAVTNFYAYGVTTNHQATTLASPQATAIYNVGVTAAASYATSVWAAGLGRAAVTAAYAKEAELQASIENAIRFLGLITAAKTGTGDSYVRNSTNGTITKYTNGTAVSGTDWRRAGDVLIDSTNAKEYIFNGTAWEELGDEENYTPKDDLPIGDIDTIEENVNSLETLIGKLQTGLYNVSAGLPAMATYIFQQGQTAAHYGAQATTYQNKAVTVKWYSDDTVSKGSAHATAIANLTSSTNTLYGAATTQAWELGNRGTTAGYLQTCGFTQTNIVATQATAINRYQATGIQTNKNAITANYTSLQNVAVTTSFVSNRANTAQYMAYNMSSQINSTISGHLVWEE